MPDQRVRNRGSESPSRLDQEPVEEELQRAVDGLADIIIDAYLELKRRKTAEEWEEAS